MVSEGEGWYHIEYYDMRTVVTRAAGELKRKPETVDCIYITLMHVRGTSSLDNFWLHFKVDLIIWYSEFKGKAV